MATNDGPLIVLHQLLGSIEHMLSLDSLSASDYKADMLALKQHVLALQQEAAAIESQKQQAPTSSKMSEAELQELSQLRSYKATLERKMNDQDEQLLKLLSQLRRLQFSIDSMDPTAYQRPIKPKDKN